QPFLKFIFVAQAASWRPSAGNLNFYNLFGFGSRVAVRWFPTDVGETDLDKRLMIAQLRKHPCIVQKLAFRVAKMFTRWAAAHIKAINPSPKLWWVHPFSQFRAGLGQVGGSERQRGVLRCRFQILMGRCRRCSLRRIPARVVGENPYVL